MNTLDVQSTSATSTFASGIRIEDGSIFIEELTEKKLLVKFDDVITATSTIYLKRVVTFISTSTTGIGTTTSSSQYPILWPTTITRVSCTADFKDGAIASSSGQLDERTEAAPLTAGTDVIGENSATFLECGTSFTNSTTSFQNQDLAAGSLLNFQVDAEPTGVIPPGMKFHVEMIEAITPE
ncbi:hypothetical protein IIA15_04040 [candidate division TA06 bacterium]|nr:hypothetical protein [candidate division TA06 bacterium]